MTTASASSGLLEPEDAAHRCDSLHQQGHRTREHVVPGGRWWLHVLDRIAER